jgi:hypothetical protein
MEGVFDTLGSALPLDAVASIASISELYEFYRANLGSPALSSPEAGPGQPHSRRALLRNVLPSDYEFLYRMSVDPVSSYRWRFRGATPSPEEFTASFWQGVLAQFIVDDAQKRGPLGLVVAYRADMRNGFAYGGFMSGHSTVIGSPIVDGFIVFLSYLFATWPLRKVYFEVPEYNLRGLQSGLDRYCVVEGRLVAYDFHDGRYWDMVIASLSRDAWDRESGRLLSRLGCGEAPQVVP